MGPRVNKYVVLPGQLISYKAQQVGGIFLFFYFQFSQPFLPFRNVTSCIVSGPLLAVEDVTKSPMQPLPVPFWMIDKLAILNEIPKLSMIDNPPADVANIHEGPLPAPLCFPFLETPYNKSEMESMKS